MSRINTNVQSLLGQRVLGQNNQSLNKSLERLSTGLAINRGADNPAGLIASEKLRSEKASISAAISNAERADQVANIAEGGLQEVSSLLLELQSLVTETANKAGLSREEKEANQLQIDSILQTIDRISTTTSFQGTKLLNGTYDFQVSGIASTVDSFQINAAKLAHGEHRDVDVVVTQSAQHGTLFLSGDGATGLDLTNNDSRFTFELGGAQGSREFTFASGTSFSDIAATINTFTDVTGVSATAITSGGTTFLAMKADELGDDHFVSFKLLDNGGQVGQVMSHNATDEDEAGASVGDLTSLASTTTLRDDGQDVAATVNGLAATTNGSKINLNTDFLDLSITLTEAGAQTQASIDAMTITGGGAEFNLGPNVDILNQVSLGIKNVASRKLGGNSVGGFLDDLASGQTANVVDGNVQTAQKIVNEAIDQISSLRGRIGAFQQNTVGATIRSLGVAFENTSAAESSIRDTDFAAETAELTRSQILVNASTNVLSIANSQPQSVLSLLG